MRDAVKKGFWGRDPEKGDSRGRISKEWRIPREAVAGERRL